VEFVRARTLSEQAHYLLHDACREAAPASMNKGDPVTCNGDQGKAVGCFDTICAGRFMECTDSN
jgi:hypothetical protein